MQLLELEPRPYNYVCLIDVLYSLSELVSKVISYIRGQKKNEINILGLDLTVHSLELLALRCLFKEETYFACK